MTSLPSPFSLWSPSVAPIPLVCDSPHSGTDYPSDFTHIVDRQLLRRGEDTHVEALWQAVPHFGGTLLAAHFPRTYIDANRTEDDLDPSLLDGPWPQPLNPGEKTRLGYGLVWSHVSAGVPIYDRPLSVAAVRHRIEQYYRPYHKALSDSVDSAMQRFGAVWHLNLHSMPSDAYERLQIRSSRPLADFVLGDRDGTSCAPAFTAFVRDTLAGFGYDVRLNDPFKGVELVRAWSDPAAGRHSLQLEVNKRLYMDPATLRRTAGFEALQAHLMALVDGILAEFGRDAVPR